jgi:hypothetical protein
MDKEFSGLESSFDESGEAKKQLNGDTKQPDNSFTPENFEAALRLEVAKLATSKGAEWADIISTLVRNRLSCAILRKMLGVSDEKTEIYSRQAAQTAYARIKSRYTTLQQEAEGLLDAMIDTEAVEDAIYGKFLADLPKEEK